MSARPSHDVNDDATKVIFALHLAEGLTAIKAAKETGIDIKTAYAWRTDPAVTAELARCQAETRKRLYRQLAGLGEDALKVYRRGLRGEGARPVMAAEATLAKDVLDRLGLGAAQMNAFFGPPDEPMTIVVPLPVVADARQQQEDRRAARLARQADLGLVHPEQP